MRRLFLSGFKFEASQILTIAGAIGLIFGVTSLSLVNLITTAPLLEVETTQNYLDFVDGRGYHLLIIAFLALLLGFSGWTKPVWATGLIALGILANDLRLMIDFTSNDPLFIEASLTPNWIILFSSAILLAVAPLVDRLPFAPHIYRPLETVERGDPRQILTFAIGGTILLIIGVFLPLYSQAELLKVIEAASGTTTGSINFFYEGQAAGIHLLVVAAVVGIAVWLKRYDSLWVAGVIAAGILGNELRHALVVGRMEIAWIFLISGAAALLTTGRMFDLVSDNSQSELLPSRPGDRLFQNSMYLGVPFFGLWFVLRERDSLGVFLDFVYDAILSIPRSFRMVTEYFTEVPTYALYPSMLVGAIAGAGFTILFYLIASGHLKIPSPPGRAVLTSFLAAVFLYFATEWGILVLIPLMVIILIVASLIFAQSWRQFFSAETVRYLLSPEALRTAGIGLIIGAAVGAISSQILLYPLEHCTYRPSSDYEFYQDTQFRMGLGLTVLSSLILLIPVWTLLQRKEKRSDQSTGGYFRNPVIPYLFLAPTLVLLVVFLYYPASKIIPLSLRLQADPIGGKSTPVCLENYVRLVDEDYQIAGRFANTEYPAYANSFSVTVTLTVAIVIFTMTLALLIALLASQKIRGANIYRTLLVWPYALSPIVTGAIFLAMFRDDSAGVINWILRNTINQDPSWLKETNLAPWVIIYAAVWNGLGFNILFYVAGLQNIPKDLLEAAAIDGANVFQRFFRITLPLLSPFTFFLLIANITYAFYGIYGAVDVLTSGGPPLADTEGGATEILIYKVYEDAFGNNAGLGAAQALILFVMVATITMLQFIFVERQVTYAGD